MLRVPNEFKVGVLATISILMLVLGYNMMRGKNLLNREKVFYAKYEYVEGLAVASHVRYKGMNVGRVQEINLSEREPGIIIVMMNISPELRIPQGSLARIVQIDLFGTKAIQIELSDAQELLVSGDTLSSSIAKDAVSDITMQAGNLLGSLDSLIVNVNSVFDTRTKRNLQQSFANIQATLENFDQTLVASGERLDRILANVESITSNLDQNKVMINNVLANLESFSDSLKRAEIVSTMEQAQSALQEVSEVMRKINEGEGTLGLLVNDQKLYVDLDSSARSLDALLIDLKANPKRYVHVSVFGGGKDKEEKKDLRSAFQEP